MWFFNVLLYFFFLANPTIYTEFVAAGSPCYVYVDVFHTGQGPSTPQPACSYDPSNINPGH
jgi:hypothetical protein